MASMLQAIIDDPTPGPSVQAETEMTASANPLLAAPLRVALEKDYFAGYDAKQGTWGFDQKYLDWDSVQYAMNLAPPGDARADGTAKPTLTAQLQLLHPLCVGLYHFPTD